MQTFNIDTELESDYNEGQAALASYLVQFLGSSSYEETLEVIKQFYKDLP